MPYTRFGVIKLLLWLEFVGAVVHHKSKLEDAL